MAGGKAQEGAFSLTEQLKLELERFKKESAPEKPLGTAPSDPLDNSDGSEYASVLAA